MVCVPKTENVVPLVANGIELPPRDFGSGGGVGVESEAGESESESGETGDGSEGDGDGDGDDGEEGEASSDMELCSSKEGIHKQKAL